MTDELRPESSAEVAVAETIDAASSDPDATRGSRPTLRSGHRTILPVDTHVGRYVVAERIGAGGMGNVYRARDPQLDRDIALKLVSATDIAAAEEYLKREAQAMAKLSHHNVAVVHDIGTWNEQLFIAMELLPEGSLATWLAKPRPWRDVIHRFVAAGRGLAAAHRIGLVHRDFKPDNVLVAADGTIKVSDFGLVRSSSGALSTGSNPDAIEGTPAYMAPEQLEGGDVDERADQFAYAVSVWEGVFGGRPFQPDVGTRDVVDGMLRAIRSRRMMRSTTAEVPNRVLEILKRALDPDPAARWPSLDALVDALDRTAKPSRAKWAALAVGVGALIAGTTATVMYVTRPPPDMQHVVASMRKSLAPIYVAGADSLRDRWVDKDKPVPAADAAPAAIAYESALASTRDNELRPRLAHVLFASGRCNDAVQQLDAYFRNGGTKAMTSHLHGFDFDEAGKRVARPLDRSILLDIKKECDDIDRLLDSPEEMENFAMQLWRTGATDRAVRILEHAYRISDQAHLLMKIGDIHRNVGDCVRAREYYERYIVVETRAPKEWLDKVRGMGETCEPAR